MANLEVTYERTVFRKKTVRVPDEEIIAYVNADLDPDQHISTAADADPDALVDFLYEHPTYWEDPETFDRIAAGEPEHELRSVKLQ